MTIEVVDLQMKYKLTPSMARALLLLLKHKIVTPFMIEVDQPITTDGKVLMHRIRRRLIGTPIAIHSQRSVGYWLEETSRDQIYKDLGLVNPGLADRAPANGETDSVAA